jgi:DNA-binding transcriptional MerR regulator/methylmalonyl-CoA mutase cobalamin-binding subunit
MPPSDSLHPLRVVVQRTGLTPDVIRVWERRYEAVRPARSEGRHRLYSEADIERLQLLARLTAAGRSIGRIAPLSTAELTKLSTDHASVTHDSVASPRPQVPLPELDDALAAISRFDGASLERMLRHAALRLGADITIDALITPLLTEIGNRWHNGTFSAANEHMATAVIRSTLAWMLVRAPAETTSPGVVVATPTRQMHELGALIAAVTATTHGWRVTYLGANLPFDDIVDAAERVRARAVALSVVHPEDDDALRSELRRGSAALPTRLGLVIGGTAAHAYASSFGGRALLMSTINDFRRWLGNAA